MPEATADQAPQQSVEDRIYAKFEAETPEHQLAREDGAEPEVEAEAEQTEPEAEFAEIEYEGSRYQVPKALEPALMKNADYTQKTQELAKQRELYEQSMSTVRLMNMEREFHDSVAQEKHNLQVLENYAKSLKAQDFNNMTTDEMVRNMHEIQRATGQYEELSKQIESKHSEFKSAFTKSAKEAKAKTHEFLSKEFTGYTPKNFEAAKEYAKTRGFTEDVLDSIETDPKASTIVYEAMLYRQLVNSKTAAVKKLDAPVIKPGSVKPMPDKVKNSFNYKNALKSAKTRDERNAIQTKYVESLF
jgi:hypothetical protein